MKIKLSWIIIGFFVVSLGIEEIHRWRMVNPTSASSFEPARENQATPVETVNPMFQMMLPGPESDDPRDSLTDRFDDAHLVMGNEMTPEEQKFAQLFVDRQRSATVYGYLVRDLGHAPRVTGHTEDGDSAIITGTERVSVPQSEEWTTAPFTLELKKKGANWYVDELKSPKMPEGVYAAFRKRLAKYPIVAMAGINAGELTARLGESTSVAAGVIGLRVNPQELFSALRGGCFWRALAVHRGS